MISQNHSSALSRGAQVTPGVQLGLVFSFLHFIVNNKTRFPKLTIHTQISKLSWHPWSWKYNSKLYYSNTVVLSILLHWKEKNQKKPKKLRSIKKTHDLTIDKYIDYRFPLLFHWTRRVSAAVSSSVICLSSAQGQSATGLCPIPSTGILSYIQPFAVLT